jgi:hypothetical protein
MCRYVLFLNSGMDWDKSDPAFFIFLKLIFCCVPLLAGAAIIFFMIKPVLAGRPKRAQPLALSPANERLLYAFIAKICDIVGAPSPQRIDLDCQVNAAAGFRRGFRSVFSHDLVLVLGLPLVANLTTRELAGVVAHEFGHFTQGTAMRLSYFINSINLWFARVAYERDAWDVFLEAWSRETHDWRAAVIVGMIHIAVSFTRLILKALMYVGVVVGGFMTRQMEYDADAYNIKVAGSECFEQTARKFATLQAAWELTRKQLAASWKRDQTLPDNLPQLIRLVHQKLPASVLRKIDDTLGLHRTGLFDSHPSPADRIRQARKAAEPGIFDDDSPASSLFASFEHPSRFVTLLHYTDDLGLPIKENMLRHVEVEKAATTEASDYFAGLLPLIKPVRLLTPNPSIKIEDDFAELNQIVSSLKQIAPQLKGYVRHDEELLDKVTSARAAHVLLSNGSTVPEGTFGMPRINVDGAATAEAEAGAARQGLKHSLREVVPTLHRRLALGVSLTLANVGDTELPEDQIRSVMELVNWLNENAGAYDLQMELAEALLTLQKIEHVKSKEGEDSAMRKSIAAAGQVVTSLADKLNPPSQIEPVDVGRLKIAKSKTDFAMVRQQNLNWLRTYDANVRELARLIVSAETFVPA